MLLYASTRRLERWVYLEVGGPVGLWKWRSASTLEAAPMWVSPTQLYLTWVRRYLQLKLSSWIIQCCWIIGWRDVYGGARGAAGIDGGINYK